MLGTAGPAAQEGGDALRGEDSWQPKENDPAELGALRCHRGRLMGLKRRGEGGIKTPSPNQRCSGKAEGSSRLLAGVCSDAGGLGVNQLLGVSLDGISVPAQSPANLPVLTSCDPAAPRTSRPWRLGHSRI